MGRNKAFLEWAGQPLWRRQLTTLAGLSPEQLMISGSPRPEWNGYEIVTDEVAEAGPLAGITAALRKCLTPCLVVLAVDLPGMETTFLRSLLQLGGDAQGAVPYQSGRFEPLAAVYPVVSVALAEAALRAGDFSLQNFSRRAREQGFVVERPILKAELHLFTNLNTPADL